MYICIMFIHDKTEKEKQKPLGPHGDWMSILTRSRPGGSKRLEVFREALRCYCQALERLAKVEGRNPSGNQHGWKIPKWRFLARKVT